VEFRLLGPLSVTTDAGGSIEIGRPKLRILLAIMLTRQIRWFPPELS
jgi:hypothetical protein